MKLFVLAAVLCSTFVVAFGVENRTVEQEPVYLKEDEATKYCNSLFPVTEDPRQKLTKVVINGDTIPKAGEYNSTEWCHLHCFLEKVGFFDAEGRMQVRRILKYVLEFFPEIAPNSDYLMLYMFQMGRELKDMDDKCAKAYKAYYKFTEGILVTTLAVDLNANTTVKDKIIESVLSEDALPKEIGVNVEKIFKSVELFNKKTVESSANISSIAAPVPPA